MLTPINSHINTPNNLPPYQFKTPRDLSNSTSDTACTLDFFNKQENLLIENKSDKEYNNMIYSPSSSKEWFSSVYSYNKSYSKSLPALEFITNKLFLSYFNMLRYKKKVGFKRRRDNKSRYSADKLYVSRAEFKHTNTKILIIISIYNKQKSTLLRNTRKIIYINRMYKIISELKNRYVVKSLYLPIELYKNLINNSRLVKAWTSVKGDFNLKRYIPSQVNRLNHKGNHLFKRKVILTQKWKMLFLKKNPNLFNNFLSNFKNKKLYKTAQYNNWLLKNNFKLVKMLFNNTRLISFNKIKFHNLGLTLKNLGLKSILEKIYSKKIVFKLVDLKSIHLNSDVFSSAVALKLRDRKNKAVKILRKAILQMVRVPDLHTLITFDDTIEIMDKNNIVNTIKQQVVSGVRFEAAGRLTKRLTAMRAVFKYRYVGSLKNIRSSFNNKASTLLRGCAKSNGQYIIINSKTRNGTFGLKGWVSSH